MRLKHLAVSGLLCFAAIACRSGRADTLTLESVGGENAGGYYVYPYNFSYDGSSDSVAMMCINFDREVTVGESWQVETQSIPTDNSALSQGDRADAWLFSQLGQTDPGTDQTYDNAEVQYAAWDILDPAGVSGNSGFDSTAQYLAQQALVEANNTSLLDSGFFSNYALVVPTSDSTGWTDGTPQEFVTDAASVTPEPSSLLLTGTGLIGCAIFLLRRIRVPKAS